MISTASGREFVFTLGGDERSLVDAARRADAALKGTTSSTEGLAAAQRGAGSATEQFLGGMERLAGLAAGGYFGSQLVGTFTAMSRALIEAQSNADRLMLQLGAGVGAARAAQELDYVRSVSQKLGLELNTTAVSYSRFAVAARGSSLEGEGARQVFDSVAKAASVMGLSVEESQGVLRALEQMMSKGTVQAEELRGQLGDRLPGALQIAARAMGVTTARLGEMVQAGEVAAVDFLPRFARQLEQELGGGAEAAADRMQAANQRMANAWELLKQDVAASGVGDFIKGQLNVAADALGNVSEAYKAARDSGSGFVGQTLAASGAVLQFLNPLNAVSYNVQTLDARLAEARASLAAYKAEAASGSGSIFLQADIRAAEALVAKLEAVGRAKINLRAIDNAMLARTDKEAEEAATTRRAALAKVTGDLAGETSKLAKAMKVIDASFAAGDLGVGMTGQAQYELLKARAQKQYGDKPGAKKLDKGNPLFAIDDQWAQAFERWRAADQIARDRTDQAAAAEEERVRQFMQDQVQRSDERLLRETERRTEAANTAQDQFRNAALQIDAGMLTSAKARGQALLAIERAQITARIAALKLEGQERQAVDDAAAQYLRAREAQLTEELKPEWQRRLDAWADVTELMAQSYDAMMTGFLEQGEDVFVRWLETGKLNTKSLVSFIGAEFAKLAYKRYIAPGLASVLDAGLKWVFGGGGEPAGGDINDPWGNGGARAAGGGVRRGSSYGIAEAEPEVFETAGGKRYLIPGSDGWVTPMAQAGGRGAGGGGGNVIQYITYQVPDGQSPAAYAAALEANNERLMAQVASDLARPGRLLNRAARSAA